MPRRKLIEMEHWEQRTVLTASKWKGWSITKDQRLRAMVLRREAGRPADFEENDGSVDKIYFKSDQHAYNYIYGKAGNSPNGEKADTIYERDAFDQIIVQGVTNSQLNFAKVSNGIGIFADGTLECYIHWKQFKYKSNFFNDIRNISFRIFYFQ